jgi:hypothetical protein
MSVPAVVAAELDAPLPLGEELGVVLAETTFAVPS